MPSETASPQRRAEVLGGQALVVEAVAGLVQDAEERVAEVVLVVARGHAHVAGAEAGAERVDADVEPAGVEVEADRRGGLRRRASPARRRGSGARGSRPAPARPESAIFRPARPAARAGRRTAALHVRRRSRRARIRRAGRRSGCPRRSRRSRPPGASARRSSPATGGTPGSRSSARLDPGLLRQRRRCWPAPRPARAAAWSARSYVRRVSRTFTAASESPRLAARSAVAASSSSPIRGDVNRSWTSFASSDTCVAAVARPPSAASASARPSPATAETDLSRPISRSSATRES